MIPLVLAGSSTVTLSEQSFRQLLPPPPEAPEIGPGALVVGRDLALTPVGTERVVVDARWVVAVDHPSAVSLRLAGPEVVVDRVLVDGAVASTVNERGSTLFVGVLTHDVTLSLRGYAPGDVGARVHLELLPAGGGVVRHPADTVVDGAIPVESGRSFGGGGDLWLAPAPVASGSGTMVLGEAGLGLTVGEAEVTARARLRWRVSRGELADVSFEVPGAGADLDVTGPQVAEWRREGDTVRVHLRAPERSLVALDVGWSTLTPTGEAGAVPVPAIRLDPVFRSTSTVQLARDPDLDVLPSLPSWQPAAPGDLPEWGQSLVEGAPVAAFVGQGGGGTLSVLRYVPADSPATLVDVASYTVATNPDGVVLVRAHYAVRNDRGAVLRLTPPPGFRPIGVRVGSEPAKLSRDGDVWRIPLEKSVETVEGLLTFPVEVLLLGEVEPFRRRDRREIALPVVDAEVAVSRLTLHLPPGWRGRSRGGDAVDAFTEGEGITYGFAVGDVRAAQADQYFQAAVDAWMSNEFDDANQLVTKLEELGAANDDIERLKSNLDLVEGEKKESGGDLLERRVLEQARVRAQEDAKKQAEEVARAEAAYQSGEYEEAEEAYKKALDLGEDLAKLYNREDRSQEALNERVAQGLSSSSAVSQQKAKQKATQDEDRDESRSGSAPLAPPAIEFADEEVTGELVRPGGSTIVLEPPPEKGRGEDPDAPAGWESPPPEEVVLFDEPELAAPSTPSPTPVTELPPPPSPDRGFGPVFGKRRYEEHSLAVSDAGEGKGQEPPDTGVFAGPADGEPAAVQVTAAMLDVVVPNVGETVLYQHLLLASGTAWVVPIDARERRRSR